MFIQPGWPRGHQGSLGASECGEFPEEEQDYSAGTDLSKNERESSCMPKQAT